MSDPIQMLIDAGAIPSEPFDSMSRYREVALALHEPGAGAPPIPYVGRRFIAPSRDLPAAAEALVAAFDRPDLIAARTLGDPLLYWRLADINAVADPFELTDQPGARIAVPGGGV